MAFRPRQRGTTETKFDIGLGKIDLDTTAVTTPYTFKFPADAGTNNYVLKTDGSGNLSWVAQAAGGTPAGSNTEVQYNNSGAFGASSNFTYDSTNRVLTVGVSGAGTIQSDGQNLTVEPKTVTSGGGKTLSIKGGGTTTSSAGGPLDLRAGGSGTGTGGSLNLYGGTGAAGGAINLSTAASSTPTLRFSILANGAWSVGSTGAETGTSGHVLTSNGSGSAPTWEAPTGGVSSLTGTSDQITVSASTGAVTLSLPSSITTPGSLITTGTLTSGNGSLGIQGAANVQQTFTSTDGQQWQNGYNAASDIFGTYDITGSNWAWYVGNGATGPVTLPRSIASSSVSTGTLVVGGGVGVSGTVNATAFAGDGSALTSLNASNLSSGTVGTARLGSGTANNTTFLRGDQTWTTISGGASYTLQPVRVATTANGTLSTAFENGDTIDGVTLATGDRILLKNQSTASQNGIYVVNASGSPTRASDFDTGAATLSGGVSVPVIAGTVNGGNTFVCSNTTAITVGSTNITFLPFGGVHVGSTFKSNNAINTSSNIAIGGITTGSNSVAIMGSNTSGTSSVTIGQCNAGANYATAIGGSSGTNTGQASISIGQPTLGARTNAISIGACAFGNPIGDYDGHIQLSTGYWSSMTGANLASRSIGAIIGNGWTQTTNETPTELGVAGDGTNTPSKKLALVDNCTYLFDVDIVARKSATGTDYSAWNLKFCINREAGAGTTALVGSVVKTVVGQTSGAASGGWDVNATADTTNGRPNISVTGQASTTIRWVANMRITKVAG